MSKNDMKNRICTLSKNDLKDLVKTYRIPQDLHPCLPDPGFTMDRLPGDAIGIYTEFLWFSGVHIPFLTFLLSVLKYFNVHISQLVPLGDQFSLSKRRNTEDVCMDDGPSSLKKWKDKYFLIDCRAILDYLTWRHSCSCIFDDLPTDGYDRNDVEQLCAHLIRLCGMREEVLVHSEMSIYDFMTLPSWSDAKIVKESHNLSSSLLDRVSSHNTAPVTEGAMIPFPTADKIATSLLDSRLDKKSKGLSQNSLERDECTSVRASSALVPRLGKRLGAPSYVADVSASRPSPVGTLVHAFTSGHNLSLGGAIASGHVGKSRAEVMRCQLDPLDSLDRSALARDVKYDQILDDDFGTATLGVSSPLYTKEEWDGPYVPKSNILCKDLFKDLDVCRKALNQTITPTELRRTESLVPLELSNHVNILSVLLVSHGYELNSRYTNLVSYKALLQEKLDQKKGDVRELCSQRDDASEEIKKLQSKLTNAKAASVGCKNSADELRAEIAHFIGSGIEGLVRKLLSSDEFYAALAHVASLGINYGFERGLHMGCIDADFKMAVQKVHNFQVGVKADFDKALVGFPTTPFPFLDKVVAEARGTLFDVAHILMDKFARSSMSVFVVPYDVNEAPNQVSL
ncbi:hypothetical protein Tco_0527233 [Tanacetum coccineum]